MILTNDFSEEIWQTTYKYDQEKCIDENFDRVATAIASVEITEELRQCWTERFSRLLKDGKFCPAGRILSNAGTNFYGTTLFNCYTGSVPEKDLDSIDGIIEVLRRQCQTLRSEGGWGLNFSWLRPRGNLIKSIGVESPGAVKYMELFNKTSDIITSGSGIEKNKASKTHKEKIRKGAMMGCLFCWHPDIEEFIQAKRTPNRLDKFNVSVCCTNVFMDAVDRVESTGIDEEWELAYPETSHEKYHDEWNGDLDLWKEKGYSYKVHKKVSIKYLWELIMKSTYEFNDPGVLFTDRANRTHLDNFSVRIYEPNPCGEQFMPRGSVCDLGSIVLTAFYNIETGLFDYDALQIAVYDAIRFLDNVNDYSRTPLPEYKHKAINKRRVGCGIMGWASLLYMMNIRFASVEAEELKEKIMSVYTSAAVQASVDLAMEKGKFTDCNNIKLYNHMFWNQIKLPNYIREQILQHGLRNSALFSIQPNGNTSSMHNIKSGGCEPIFLHEWIRTMIVQVPPEHLKDKCPKYWQGEFNENEYFKYIKEGQETLLKYKDEYSTVWKIDKNRGLTKEVLCEDYAVKLLKENNSWNPNADWAVTTGNLSVDDHITDLTGWAKWIDSAISKTVNIPNDYPYEEFKKLYLDAYKSGTIKGITTYRAGTMATVLSEVKKESIIKTNAPKRGRNLPAQVFHPSIKGQKYCVAVGLLSGDPYEVFACKVENKLEEAEDTIIHRVKSGHYQLVTSDGKVLLDDLSSRSDHLEEEICRLASTSLRHGADIRFVVEQLNKSKGDIYAIGHVLGRVLKKFIPDNTISGEKCPECDNKLIYREGCKSCTCGWSKC